MTLPAKPRTEQSDARSSSGQEPGASAGISLRASGVGCLCTGVRITWDRLGLVISASLTCFILFCLPLAFDRLLPTSIPPFMHIAVILTVAVATLSAPYVGVFYLAHGVFSHEEVAYGDMWRGARRLYRQSTAMGFLQVLALSIFFFNLRFYLHLGGLMGAVVSVLCGYALVFWLMMSVYHAPILVAQEMGVFDQPDKRARRGTASVLRRSFYLTVGTPLFTFGTLCGVLAIGGVLYATAVGAAMLGVGTIAFLLTSATRAVLIQYEVIPPPCSPDLSTDQGFRLGGKS